jgi:hypothetical protein
MVNAVLLDAIRAGASDIHIEPQEKALYLRYRVDGMLRHVMTIPKKVQNKVISRIKIMAHMDIAEHRKPQDGRTRLVSNGKQYDMRVSSLPTADGEKIVIRILVQSRASVALEDLGFEPDMLATFKEMLSRPAGHDPRHRPDRQRQDLDPVRGAQLPEGRVHEHRRPSRTRSSTAWPASTRSRCPDKAGLTFAAGLRSILRQDPNVIMVGEIRDLETAQVAVPGRADRAPRALHAAHERRAQRRHPPRADGHPRVPGGLVGHRRAGAAAGAEGVRLPRRFVGRRRAIEGLRGLPLLGASAGARPSTS